MPSGPAEPPPTPKAVLLDFYGTVARATRWVSADEVLKEHGYVLPVDAYQRWFNDGIDGMEHDEHSQSREHYIAWQRARTLAMLAETDVHPGEYEEILTKLRGGASTRTIEAYDEAETVLRALRDRGLRLVVCSNWDWDLAEAVEEAGLTPRFDALVSSAWVGARKPHPRIYRAALLEARVEPAEALFVGDTWGPDVEGPRAAGMAAAYLRRDGHWPDGTCPVDEPVAGDVPVLRDLSGLLDLVDGVAVPSVHDEHA
jgi:putative hydrolase of the HAD superfamily